MKEDTGWDWVYLITTGKVMLKLSYKEFWHETSPLMFDSMLTEYLDIKKHYPYGL